MCRRCMQFLIGMAALTGVGIAGGGCGAKSAPERASGRGGLNPSGQVASSAEEAQPLRAGDRVPVVALVDAEGRAVELSRLIAERPAVIIFYRGGWCPYCNAHLKALKSMEADLLKLGYQVLAVSPDRPEKLRATRGKLDLGYRLLSDSKMLAANAFRLAFRLDEATLEKYKGYNIDLEDASGEDHHMLPVPAVFVAGTDGVIRFAHADPNYKERLEPANVLEAAGAAVR